MKNNTKHFLHLTFLSACLSLGGGLSSAVSAQDFKSLDKQSVLLGADRHANKGKDFIVNSNIDHSMELSAAKDSDKSRAFEDQKRFVFAKPAMIEVLADSPSASHSRSVSALAQRSLVQYYKLKDYAQEQDGQEGVKLRTNLFNSLSELTHELKKNEYSKDRGVLDVTARMSMVVLADVLQEQKEMDHIFLNPQAYSLNFAVSEYLQEYKKQSFIGRERVNKVSSLKPYK